LPDGFDGGRRAPCFFSYFSQLHSLCNRPLHISCVPVEGGHNGDGKVAAMRVVWIFSPGGGILVVS